MNLFFWIALNWLDERTRNNLVSKRVVPLIGARWICHHIRWLQWFTSQQGRHLHG